jgi:DNA-binding transcriptional LysR family regulator
MELRHFRYFAAVARYLNYNEASRRLHVAQPAISKTISDLEEEIGAKLFLRNKRTVRLTAAGTILLGEAENILKRSEDAKRAVQRAARGEVGILRIGFIAPATAPILPSLVQAYARRYPDVELKLHHMNPDDQLAAFDEGLLDLGLRAQKPVIHKLIADFCQTSAILIIEHNSMIALPRPANMGHEKLFLNSFASRLTRLRLAGRNS